jgi:probable HAF family extracellular repeat protein
MKRLRGTAQLIGAVVGGLVLLGAAAGARATLPVYTLTDLGELGGGSSEAHAINELGQVVGRSAVTTGAFHPFLNDGTPNDLGTLEGGTSGEATAVNDLGEVVGYGGINGYGPEFAEITQAFLWRNGTLRSLGALWCECGFNRRYGYSEAHAINSRGQVVGFSEARRCGSQHAFLWQDGAMEDISGGPGDPSYSRAYAINDSGQVAGLIARDACSTPSPSTRAFVWDAGAIQELGVLDGHTSSAAYGINEAGHVVGRSGDGSASRATLWDREQLTDLGVLAGDASSSALDLNDTGQVVGYSWGTDEAPSRAFLWQAGTMNDLNQLIAGHPDWVLLEATAINDAGEIVGFGLHHGRMRAYRLTPRGGPRTAARPPTNLVAPR